MRPGFKAMIALFERSGIALSEQEARRFWQFHTHLRERNAELDLTRITHFDNMVLKHYVDCALVTEFVELPSPLLDIGSGAGFPGIPIKIRRPEIELILAEGRRKRVDFLQEVCDLLGLSGVTILHATIKPDFDLPVQGVITRAVETIGRTLARVEAFLPQGGEVIFMKGPHCDEELAEALRRLGGTYELKRDTAYVIPQTPHRRRLIVFKRREEARPRARRPLTAAAAPHGAEAAPPLEAAAISSAANPFFKDLQKMTRARGIKKLGTALFWGAKNIAEVLADFPAQAAGILYCEGEHRPEMPLPSGLPAYVLARELFRQIDLFDTRYPVLIVRLPSMDSWSAAEAQPGCTLLVPFQDPANVGAVIRTAAAFAVDRVVLLQEASHPFHPKAVRAAGSTLFRAPLLEGPSIETLRPDRLPLIALSPTGRDIGPFRFPERFCLIPGLEGPGLTEVLAKAETLSIPMAPGVESLNAALAAGIALYLWRRGLDSGRPAVPRIQEFTANPGRRSERFQKD